MKLFHCKKAGGFTISEMLISGAVASVLSMIMIVGAVVIQRNFIASDRYARNVAHQTRLLDFLAMDLRRALAVSSVNGQIRITIPDFYDSNGAPRNPVIAGGAIHYGGVGASQQVVYYRDGSKMIRSQNGATEVIAEDVQDFDLGFTDQGQVVEISVSFLPTFQQGGGGNREATKTYVRTLLRNKRQA